MGTSHAYSECFRVVREQASTETRKEILQQYVLVLKEQTKIYREIYEETFFRFTDLQGVANPTEYELIKRHVLTRLERTNNSRVLRMATGIGKAITKEDVHKGIARTVWSPLLATSNGRNTDVIDFVRCEIWLMSDEVRSDFIRDFSGYERFYRDRGLRELADTIRELTDPDPDIPF
jgi:hypothetical protein